MSGSSAATFAHSSAFSFRRWEEWPGGVGFPFSHGSGKAGTGRGRWRYGGDATEWERREREAEKRAEAEALGAEEELGGWGDYRYIPLILPTPSFVAAADEG